MRRWYWSLPLLAVAAIFALRLATPPDIRDNDQARPIDYIVDAAADGHWIVQRDAGGAISSKPPLYTWLAAGSSLAFGGNRFALYLPCALAMAGCALIAALLTRRRLGWAAGLAAGMTLALASDTMKAVALARTDAVFAVCTALAAWLALRSWESGRGWIVFWVMCGIVCIAKSPVGVLFAAGGLHAACWREERPALELRPTAWKQHALGVLLMLGLAGGWFLLAVASAGQPVIDKMIGRELVGHALANDNGTPLYKTFFRPPWWHFALFLPWSLLTCAALWRLTKHPPVSPRRRRFLRFMACWLGFGLLVLCLAPHKRMILALPMLLPAAVLAGAEAGRWLGRFGQGRQVAIWSATTAVMLGIYLGYLAARDPERNRITESQGVIATGDVLSRLSRLGVQVASQGGVPSTVRYFTLGWPPRIDDAAGFLARPGPGAVAVRAKRTVAGAAKTMRISDDLAVVLDAEAALLVP